MAGLDGEDAADESVDRADKRQQKCKGTEYIHKASAPPRRDWTGVLHAASLGHSGRSRFVPAWRRFVLRSTFGLHMLCDETSVGPGPALDKSLRLVDKGIGKRVAAHVA